MLDSIVQRASVESRNNCNFIGQSEGSKTLARTQMDTICTMNWPIKIGSLYSVDWTGLEEWTIGLAISIFNAINSMSYVEAQNNKSWTCPCCYKHLSHFTAVAIRYSGTLVNE